MNREKNLLKAIARSGLFAFFLLSLACGGKKTEQTPLQGQQADRLLNQRGQQALAEKHWDEGRGLFQQLLDTYPRSELAGDARIGVADSYFNQRGASNLILAIAEYRDFLTFFPNHPRADYAQYQIAQGYMRQTKSIDRDQAPTRSAVEELQRLIQLYRNSPYAEEGRKLLLECHEVLASHEFQVGSFYLKTLKACRGAIARCKNVLEKYPSFSKTDGVYFELGEAHVLCNNPMEAMPYYQQLIDKFPDSSLKEKAEERLDALLKKSTLK